MKKILLSGLTLLFLALNLAAQSSPKGTIRGTVINGSTKEPFAQVNVGLYTMPDTVLVTGIATGNDGTFVLKNLATNRYLLQIKFVGFASFSKEVILEASSPEFDAGVITLNEQAQGLKGVEVVGVKPGIILQGDKKILNVAQLKQTGATTLEEILENAPGITRDAEGNVLLRGSSDYKLLIDGKPAPAAGTSLLKQLPADMVENIEIMTNPSAKYEAEGSAGIINLVLKKQKSAGFNGQATATAGWNNKYIGDWQMGYRKNKINLFAGVSGNYIETNATGFINRTQQGNSGSIDRFSDLIQDIKVKSLNVNAGMDYDINDNNSVSVSGRFGKIYNDVDVVNRITVGITDGPVNQWLLYTNKLRLDGNFYNPQFNFKHNFDSLGQTLDFDVFAGGFDGNLIQEMQENPSDDTWTPANTYNTRDYSTNKLKVSDIRVKADYVKPFAKGDKLEAGFQFNRNSDASDFHYMNWLPSGSTWVDNPTFTNLFELSRNIYAGYGIYSGKVKKITYSIGLRAEYTDQLVDQKTLNQQFDSKYLDLFPSGSGTLELPKAQSLQFSFSRRINRPSGMNLNPFAQFIDNQTVRTGNPQLLPEYIQAYEMTYQKQTKIGMVSAIGYYRGSRNIENFSIIMDSLNRINLMPVNADRSHSMGLELNGNLQAAKWLMLMPNMNLYYYILQDPEMKDEIKNSILTWTARLNTVFLFGPNTRFVVSGNYTGPTVMLQGRQAGSFMLNLGLTQTILDRKATLTLGVRDLLKTSRMRLENYSDGLSVITEFRPESPMVTLTFTYNINNYRQRAQEEQMDLNFIR
jgi:hypothetical protein